MYRDTILVYRRAHVQEKRQFGNCQQSHATGKKKMYEEQDIFQTHLLCSCLNRVSNQSAGTVRKDNSNTEKKRKKTAFILTI